MGLQEIVSWYQKKIGRYDKQEWERTIEQRILHGLTNVPKKSAKLKTELIDVDLVRGSSFPKAKPKHGFVTVFRLAALRLIFLPFYGKWWAQQTSFGTFAILLLIYTLQVSNMMLFYYMINHKSEDMLERVSQSEVVLPAIMMLILSLIHSQIVSTHSGTRSSRVPSSRSRRVRRTKRRVTPANSRSRSKLEDPLFGRRRRSGAERPRIQVVDRDTTPLDDDGFESLNGNGSSENGEEEKSAVEVSPVAVATTERGIADRSALNWHPDGEDKPTDCQPADAAVAGSSGENEGDFRATWIRQVLTKRIACVDGESVLIKRRGSQVVSNLPSVNVVGADSEDEGRHRSGAESDDEASPVPRHRPLPPSLYNSSCESEANQVSAGEWPGITTNSDDCSYSSELDQSDQDTMNDHPFAWEFNLSTTVFSPSCASSDRVSCTMWEHRDAKKADLSVLDISSAIIARVESMPNDSDYFYGGFILSLLLSLAPSLCRLFTSDLGAVGVDLASADLSLASVSQSLVALATAALGHSGWERVIVVVALLERCILASMFFFLLAVAERTFKQRFLFAKLFSQLTSSRRARKSDLPHFRLNKVRNIKTWLSVRSYLKRRGPQRSVDVIVSAAFIITLLLLSFLSVECLKDSVRMHSQYILEALVWSLGLGVFLLRFMTLGTKINRKYRNLSVLITEQINLYLQIEQKPQKKDELMVANSVLKLAADLLKELESPFKISGLSANPYLYTITKVVILSALSGVLSEILGFKLKLHKIKIK